MATVSESSISARQTSAPASSTDEVRERARFFSGREPFKGLSQEELEDVASSIVERLVLAGEVVLVESGVPGTELYVIRDGTFDLTYKETVVAVLAGGQATFEFNLPSAPGSMTLSVVVTRRAVKMNGSAC